MEVFACYPASTGLYRRKMDQHAAPICCPWINQHIPLNKFVTSRIEGARSLIKMTLGAPLMTLMQYARWKSLFPDWILLPNQIPAINHPNSYLNSRKLSIAGRCPFNFVDSTQCSVPADSRDKVIFTQPVWMPVVTLWVEQQAFRTFTRLMKNAPIGIDIT